MAWWFRPGDEIPQIVRPLNDRAFSLEEMRTFLGGYLELFAKLPDGRLCWCNEHGKLDALPPNWGATALLRPWLHAEDVLVGNVLICTREEAGEDDLDALDDAAAWDGDDEPKGRVQ
jgi:hypothetical protein